LSPGGKYLTPQAQSAAPPPEETEMSIGSMTLGPLILLFGLGGCWGLRLSFFVSLYSSSWHLRTPIALRSKGSKNEIETGSGIGKIHIVARHVGTSLFGGNDLLNCGL